MEKLLAKTLSFAPEVMTRDSGVFIGNKLRFATRFEAQAWIDDLSSRWFAVSNTRIVESTSSVNCYFQNGKLEYLES